MCALALLLFQVCTSSHTSPRLRYTPNKLLASVVASLSVLCSQMPCIPPALALTDSESSTIQVFERSTPSVVFINTYTQQLDYNNMNVMDVRAGQGSGFIWDNQGHVVTNYHVIKNAARAEVTVRGTNGKIINYAATVRGTDPDKVRLFPVKYSHTLR